MGKMWEMIGLKNNKSLNRSFYFTLSFMVFNKIRVQIALLLKVEIPDTIFRIYCYLLIEVP